MSGQGSKEMKQIDTIKANVDMSLRIDEDQEQRQERSSLSASNLAGLTVLMSGPLLYA